MSELSSTEFRKRFARLSEPTMVTVNGHVIGQWLPNGFMPALVAEFGDDVLDAPEGTMVIQTVTDPQTRRDDLLRKINRSR